MEKTKHLFENSIYHISNHSVALNGMFLNEELQMHFIEKMEFYLSPIANIIAYDISGNGFQILLRLKDRSSFTKHFLSKRKSKEFLITDIPESTYIFSQAMANLQVSFVKHFNHKYKRSGTLMASRFGRKLVESEQEMQDWIQKLNNSEKNHVYHGRWLSQMESSELCLNSLWIYDEGDSRFKREHQVYQHSKNFNLGSIFSNLPLKALPSTKFYFLNKFNLLFGP